MPDDLADLGVRITRAGGQLKVWSASASSMELCLFDPRDLDWVVQSLPMVRDEANVWSVTTTKLKPGTRYSIRADGPDEPGHVFDPNLHLIDPYARGLARSPSGQWRGFVHKDEAFDWGKSQKPNVALDHTILYEVHAKGISQLNPALDPKVRGTYAGLGHPSTIEYLLDLGVTAIELLPVQQFVSEQRLIEQGLTNYWGYNTLNFFAPHAAYATRKAQASGPGAILHEFKTMVKALHEAGLEVILDVVYNHTAEEGYGGPTTSFRGIDNKNYYRQTEDGHYVDVTGCGNSVNTATPAAARLILDSLRYWANELHVDGFRFDLAVTLGRGAGHEFDPAHPLLTAIRTDPGLENVKIIAEPWDIGKREDHR